MYRIRKYIKEDLRIPQLIPVDVYLNNKPEKINAKYIRMQHFCNLFKQISCVKERSPSCVFM
jgi:hypothetical protein